MPHFVRRLLFAGVLAAALLSPSQASAATAPSKGVNDWSCTPSADHPLPVVLVHGTWGSAAAFTVLGPRLAADGYCVFALNYGAHATRSIPTSAAQLGDYVDRVIAATGAAQVSLVGHSQGGMMPRYYLRFLGGAAKVDELIGVAPSNHGTTTVKASPLLWVICPACAQQAFGSPFLTQLNADHEVETGVDYTVLVTTRDEVVLPILGQYLAGPAAQLTNVTLQNACPDDDADHITIIEDDIAAQWVENALGHDGPASPSFAPNC